MAWTLPDRAVLGIWADRPDDLPAGSLPPEVRAALLADCLDTWDSPRTLAPGGRRVALFGPDDAGPWFDARVPGSFALQARAGGDSAVPDFLAGEVADGADRVVLIGPGTPTLDPTLVVSAFLCLDGRDLVVGPAASGGVYLVGARASADLGPLVGLDLARPDGLARLLAQLDEDGPTLAVLPPWSTVTTPADGPALVAHLAALARSGSDVRLPRLRALIAAKPLDGAADFSQDSLRKGGSVLDGPSPEWLE